MVSADRNNMMNREVDIPDNKTGHPLVYYRKALAGLDPKSVSARTGLDYDAEGKEFKIRLLNREVGISWPDGVIRYLDGDDALSPYAEILLLRILVEGNLAPSAGSFLPYSEIGWGESYLKAFNGRCIGRFSHTFKNSEEFSRCARSLGAKEVNEADATFDFEFVNDVFMRLSMWDADDEFPTSVQILFSDNTPVTFTAEDAAVMGDLLLNELSSAKKAL